MFGSELDLMKALKNLTNKKLMPTEQFFLDERNQMVFDEDGLFVGFYLESCDTIIISENRWFKVEDKLPGIERNMGPLAISDILLFVRNGYVYEGWFQTHKGVEPNKDDNCSFFRTSRSVEGWASHWMYKPKAPINGVLIEGATISDFKRMLPSDSISIPILNSRSQEDIREYINTHIYLDKDRLAKQIDASPDLMGAWLLGESALNEDQINTLRILLNDYR